ncbi:MAG: hypothetical protein ACI9YP_001292, partial [Colwellia sp.]
MFNYLLISYLELIFDISSTLLFIYVALQIRCLNILVLVCYRKINEENKEV